MKVIVWHFQAKDSRNLSHLHLFSGFLWPLWEQTHYLTAGTWRMGNSHSDEAIIDYTVPSGSTMWWGRCMSTQPRSAESSPEQMNPYTCELYNCLIFSFNSPLNEKFWIYRKIKSLFSVNSHIPTTSHFTIFVSLSICPSTHPSIHPSTNILILW